MPEGLGSLLHRDELAYPPPSEGRGAGRALRCHDGLRSNGVEAPKQPPGRLRLQPTSGELRQVRLDEAESCGRSSIASLVVLGKATDQSGCHSPVFDLPRPCQAW